MAIAFGLLEADITMVRANAAVRDLKAAGNAPVCVCTPYSICDKRLRLVAEEVGLG